MPKGRVPYPFGKCTVCSDQATGNHYGAVTCEGCKGFFKRSLGKSHTYRCRGSYNCSVGTDNRIKCKACRFKRCKELGMSMSAIKMGRIPKAEKLRALESAFGGDLGAAAAAAASSSASAEAAASSSLMPAREATDGGSSPPSSSEAGHVGVEAAAGRKFRAAAPDSPLLDDDGADDADELRCLAAGDPAIRQPAAAVVAGLGGTDVAEDCADDGLDAALDLSSKATKGGHLRPLLRQSTAGRAAVGRGGLTGAMRQLTMVNSLIAKHVRAMDGGAFGDRAAAEAMDASEQDLSQTVFASVPPGDRFADAEDLQQPAKLAGRRRRLLSARVSPAASFNSRLLSASSGNVEEQTMAARACGRGGIRCGSRSSGQVPTWCSSSTSTSSNGPQDGHSDFVLSAFDTAGPPVELLPIKTLSETVQAVSGAYLKMCAATRRCIDVMSRRIAAGQNGADYPSTAGDSPHYALEQVMIGFDLLGNKLMGFIKSCPGLSALWTEDVLALAKRSYLSIWLVLESPLFRDGESHMLLPNGRRHARSWMRLYLPDGLVERMHAYARAQVAARLTVPELGLMCGLLLTSCRGNQSLSDEAAVTRLNSIFTQALSYEVHRGRLHPHRILASIWRLLAILQDVNDSHEALARCGSSSSSGAAAEPQTSPC